MADLRDRLDRLANRFPERGGLEGLDRRRGRRPERQRFLTAVLALLIAAAGITGAYVALRPTGEIIQPAPIHLSDVLRIECDGQSARVLTPTVRAQSDGVHLEVTNTAEFETTTSISSSLGSGGSPTVPPGATGDSVAASLPPGGADVWCGPSRTDVNEGPPEDQVEIVDPEGYWHPESLDCQGGRSIASPDLHIDRTAAGEPGPPIDIIRRRFPEVLREDDIVDHGGYPDADASQYGSTVRVVRAEHVVGRFHFVPGALVDGEPTYLQDSFGACEAFTTENLDG
ncbi:MAG: hypothetical protein WD770_01785 [Actinomycetota bacterium]